MENIILSTENINEQFDEIVCCINECRKKVFRIANSALIDLYWQIGERLSFRVRNSQWGNGVIRRLADYITVHTPETKGFSDKNLWRMKQFYETYCSADTKLSLLLRQISWTNNLTIMSR